jgi:hypothetical protein
VKLACNSFGRRVSRLNGLECLANPVIELVLIGDFIDAGKMMGLTYIRHQYLYADPLAGSTENSMWYPIRDSLQMLSRKPNPKPDTNSPVHDQQATDNLIQEMSTRSFTKVHLFSYGKPKLSEIKVKNPSTSQKITPSKYMDCQNSIDHTALVCPSLSRL